MKTSKVLSMRVSTKSAIICSLCVFLSAITAWAAITGSISGVVTDPSGAVLPGVTVVATEISTNVRQTTVTDGKGFYAFPALSVGHYSVTASQTGFRDMPVSTRAGLAVAVANAAPELKAICHYVTRANGGEVVELVLKAQGRWEEAIPQALA